VDVRLRETLEADLPILFDHQRDPLANEMAAFPPRDWEAFIAHQAKIRADPAAITRIIVVDGDVAGWVACWGDDERAVGFWVGREHWGKGVATAALAAFIEIVGERPLVAHVAVHNVGSRRVLEKCGFEEIDRVGADDDVEEIVLQLNNR
jgi:RimJ/RimL family protein N-acetyltransferase